MFVMVNFHGAGVDMRLQRVKRIGQRRHGKWTRSAPLRRLRSAGVKSGDSRAGNRAQRDRFQGMASGHHNYFVVNSWFRGWCHRIVHRLYFLRTLRKPEATDHLLLRFALLELPRSWMVAWRAERV